MLVLGDRLRELREDIGLRQDELAIKLNISRSTYANYETSRAEPSISILLDIANIYGVSVDFIVGNTDIRDNYYKDQILCKYINKCLLLYKEFFRP
jgi:transcriptional regulator with XRE-family HTH domain